MSGYAQDQQHPAPAHHGRQGSRATTVVFGLLVVALGAIAALVGAGVVLDPVLALVAVLVLLAAGLLLSAIRPQRR